MGLNQRFKQMLRPLSKKSLILALAASFNVALLANAATPELDDFAYTAPLSDAQTSLRQFHLPIDAYAKLYRHDYGDLRIFSAEGQVVPHQLNLTKTSHSTQISNLTFYPFDKVQASALKIRRSP